MPQNHLKKVDSDRIITAVEAVPAVSAVSADGQNTARPLFRRLTSSLPKKVTKDSEPLLSEAPVTQAPATRQDVTSTDTNKTESDVLNQKTVRVKLGSLQRLKWGRSAKSGKTNERKRLPEFPPSSWGIDGRIDGKTGLSLSKEADSQLDPENGESKLVDLTSSVIVSSPPEKSSVQDPAFPEVVSNAEFESEERTEPRSIAKRIQLLLSLLTRTNGEAAPSPSIPTPSDATSTPTAPTDPTPIPSTTDPTASDQPDDPSVPPKPTIGGLVTDSRLVSLLSSASVMNGTGKARESVWAILDRLGLSSRPNTPDKANSNKGKGKEMDGQEADKDEDVMLYTPLQPLADSQIELAASNAISCDDNLEDQPESNMPERQDKEPDSNNIVNEWVPSRTKISVHATWWGYRIYLPPPVLKILNNKSLEAAKRAALITTALKWLLDHLPVGLLPPQLRPAAALLKRLIPLLGYIGSFIAWSWGAIKAFDKGHGVILSATWLLPVALIPGTWEEEDISRPVVEHKQALAIPRIQ